MTTLRPDSVQRIVRLVAGTFIVASTALGYLVTPWAFAFTAFVGLNLLQSAFTDTCPLMTILRRLGVPKEGLANGREPAQAR